MKAANRFMIASDSEIWWILRIGAEVGAFYDAVAAQLNMPQSILVDAKKRFKAQVAALTPIIEPTLKFLVVGDDQCVSRRGAPTTTAILTERRERAH